MKDLIKSKSIILFLIFMVAVACIQEQSIKKDSSQTINEMSQINN